MIRSFQIMCAHVCVHVYVNLLCVHVGIFMCAYMYDMCVSVFMYVHMCMSVFVCACMCICVCVCIYLYVCVCVCVCVCVGVEDNQGMYLMLSQPSLTQQSLCSHNPQFQVGWVPVPFPMDVHVEHLNCYFRDRMF